MIYQPDLLEAITSKNGDKGKGREGDTEQKQKLVSLFPYLCVLVYEAILVMKSKIAHNITCLTVITITIFIKRLLMSQIGSKKCRPHFWYYKTNQPRFMGTERVQSIDKCVII